MTTLPRLTLVLGGARSGKSRHAEQLLMRAPPPWTYVATAEALDDEMLERIAHHRHRRDERWHTLDVPMELVDAIAQLPGPALVDCLTLWLTNVMLAGRDVDHECERLAEAMTGVCGPL